MKRLLIPLLAALALPTAVNAEIIRLQCGGDGTMTNLTEFSINENSGQATIVDDGKIIKTRDVFATSDTFIIGWKPDNFFTNEIQINRNDGSYIFKLFRSYDEFDEIQGLNRSVEDQRRKEAKPLYGKSNCQKVKSKKKLF